MVSRRPLKISVIHIFVVAELVIELFLPILTGKITKDSCAISPFHQV